MESISENSELPNVSEWDESSMLERTPGSEDAKSEEERIYERDEAALKQTLECALDCRTAHIEGIIAEYDDIFRQAGHESADDFDESFRKLSADSGDFGHENIKKFYEYVDSVCPSPFKPKNDDEEQDLGMIESEYRRSAMREGEANQSNIEKIAKLFIADGSQRDLYIGNSLNNLAESSRDFSTLLSQAVIAYLNDPTPENRQKLNRVQANHEGAMTSSLFNIANAFDESLTTVGKNLFDPTVAFASYLMKDGEDFFDGIVGYLEFKKSHSDPSFALAKREN